VLIDVEARLAKFTPPCSHLLVHTPLFTPPCSHLVSQVLIDVEARVANLQKTLAFLSCCYVCDLFLSLPLLVHTSLFTPPCSHRVSQVLIDVEARVANLQKTLAFLSCCYVCGLFLLFTPPCSHLVSQVLIDVEARVANLQKTLAVTQSKARELAEQEKDTQIKLERAAKLVGGLGSEQTRWESLCKSLEEGQCNLIGNMVNTYI